MSTLGERFSWDGKSYRRCGKSIIGTREFLKSCESAGLHVDYTTGQVSARIGSFVASGATAFDKLDTQKRSQDEAYQQLEDQRGFRCESCGFTYCLEYLSSTLRWWKSLPEM